MGWALVRLSGAAVVDPFNAVVAGVALAFGLWGDFNVAWLIAAGPPWASCRHPPAEGANHDAVIRRW